MMSTKDDILQLWLDWVEDRDNTWENCGHITCFFCGGRYYIYGKEHHEDDCVYKVTKEYIGE